MVSVTIFHLSNENGRSLTLSACSGLLSKYKRTMPPAPFNYFS